MLNKRIKEYIMRRKMLLIVSSVVLLSVVGFGGLTYLEIAKLVGYYTVEVNGKVVDENGNPLDDVRMKVIYSKPGFTPPDFQGEKTIEHKNISRQFNLKWWGNSISIRVGKKGYHPVKAYFSKSFDERQKEINQAISTGKIEKPSQDEWYRPYANQKYDFDVVIKLRKIGANPIPLLDDGDWRRYRPKLEKPGRIGVKFTDDTKPDDKYDVSLLMGEENGKLNAWIETPKNGGIIILPEQNIHEMFEAPEFGYQQNVYLGTFGNVAHSYYLKTAGGRYVKGHISGGFNPARKFYPANAEVNFAPCAIQPDGSRSLETINTDLMYQLFEPEDEGEETEDK
jgi:hypothetical protein